MQGWLELVALRWQQRITPGVLLSAFKTALVVGSVLLLINQYEAFTSDVTLNFTKALLSYCVPFTVFLYGRLSAPAAL